VINGDFREPEAVLGKPAVTDHLDFDQPVALLLVALLHFIDDDARPGDVLATYRDALAPGSYLALSHATHELPPSELTDFHRNLYRQTATPMTMRARTEVEGLFSGFDLIEPGVVLGDLWRPVSPVDAHEAERFPLWAGIGRKP
jgi:hypothetical protein